MGSGIDKELRYLPGVGPRRAEMLARLGLGTVAELLLAAPRRLEDRRELTPVGRLRAGRTATVAGRISGVDERRISGGRHLLEVDVSDDSGGLSAVFFNQPWLSERFARGAEVVLTGKVEEYRGWPRMSSPEFEILEAEETAAPPGGRGPRDAGPSYAELAFGRLVPVYGLTEGLGQRFMRRLVWRALDGFAAAWPEALSDDFRRSRRLLGMAGALCGLHFPESPEHAAAARRRLAYEELLVLQLALAVGRQRLAAAGAARPYPVSALVDQRIRARLPFKLTAAQDRAVAEVCRDLARPEPMNRLLQGDVGSGKTAVAAYACLAVIAGKGQAAVMAPTEVLADQHLRTFTKLLAGSRVRIASLGGAVAGAERRRVIAAVAAGEVDLVIGTHAVIEEEVAFKRLGLAVLDEQHKFGVEQRLALSRKGGAPHVLVVSATPIPRTLAQAYYADLDLSTLDEMPGGARRVATRAVTQRGRERAWRFVAGRLARGERAYVIHPAIEERGIGERGSGIGSGSMDTASRSPLPAPRSPAPAAGDGNDLATAERGFKELSARFGAARVGLLHGRLSPEAKREVMDRFRSGEIAVLVSTTVVEVGLDVPEATVMVVENAERFGLAALHQLRGRIGRATSRPRAWFICVAGAAAPEGLARLKVLASTSDGFRIAEEDLRLRGPGEFLGSRQHGLPELRFADLAADLPLLEMARRDAREIVGRDPELARPGHRLLRARLDRLAAEQRRLAGTA